MLDGLVRYKIDMVTSRVIKRQIKSQKFFRSKKPQVVKSKAQFSPHTPVSNRKVV